MHDLLIDTHILLAVIDGRPGDLPRHMQTVLREDGDRFVSVASLWEIAIKVHLGKLHIAGAIGELPETCLSHNFILLDVRGAHAVTKLHVEPDTRDPFDRMLLAQCQCEGMLLLTQDRILETHPLAWR